MCVCIYIYGECSNTRMFLYTCTNKTRAHARTHTQVEHTDNEEKINKTCTHTYIHTYIHTHTQAPLGNVLRSLLVQVMCRGSSSTTTCEPWRLARLLFCAGHIAIKMLACAEGIGAEQARTMEANTNQGKPLDPCILVFLIMISLCLVYG